jgi:mono/diheme cytochrome c family protein
MLKRAYAATAMVASAAAFSVSAQDLAGAGNVRAGREMAVTTCSECHVVVPRRLTPRRLDGPPDFVDIANAPGTTRMGLFVFLHTPHPTMPNLILSARESNYAIAYILSLRKAKSR